MRIIAADSTDLFVGDQDDPLQIVRITVANPEPRQSPQWQVRIRGEQLSAPDPAAAPALEPDGRATVEVGVAVSRGIPAGAAVGGEVILSEGRQESTTPFELIVAEPGWRMFMVPHFHYDPVWWNTQSAYTEEWDALPVAQERRLGFQATGMDLVAAHLETARRDPDYRFVLAELDYLKPYWDAYPEQRDWIRALLRDGRLELVGGTYNEANTNLVSAENTARNAVYGVGYQRDVLGGDPQSAWQLDVFGHDPHFPGLMAAAGLTSASFARGPFHEWGPNWSHGLKPELRERHSVGGAELMQFPTEFEWVAPSGEGLLTCYMANHYSAGWWMDAAASLEEAEAQAHRLFTELKAVAATRNVLLPVGTDYSPPNRWVTEIQRDWNARYVWPRFTCATASEFFDAVRDELDASQRRLVPQTRDMNPIYTGKDVSYIDTKQMHRAAETTLLTAEKFATLASLLGARYPAEAIDKAWRQLLYNAHHDGITGSESDQVYLDLLAGWREAHDLAIDVRDRSLAHLGAHVDTSGPGQAVTVFNPMSWRRTDIARVELRFDGSQAAAVDLRDDAGEAVPYCLEGAERRDDGSLASARLAFVARDVPGIGYRTYRAVPGAVAGADPGWQASAGSWIENHRYTVELDAERGGAITFLYDKLAGKELLRRDGLANEVLAYEEYPDHPHFGEGPWHLTPTSEVASSRDEIAQMRAERCPIGQRIIATLEFHGCRWTHEITLWDGVDRVEIRTHLDDWAGQDTLFRVRLAADVEGGLPISEVSSGVVGRGFGLPDVDVAQARFTLDNPCGNWFGIGATAQVRLRSGAARAIGVAEIVAPEGDVSAAPLRELVTALVRQGVTSTLSIDCGPRYGRIDLDSNLPDVRIAVGGPDRNAFTAAVLDAADPVYAGELERQLTRGPARVWVPAERPLDQVWGPGADLRGPRDLPVLILADADEAVTAVIADLDDAVVEVDQPPGLDGATGRVENYTLALLNRGTPGFAVDPSGSLHLSLLRACSGWPSGVWIDPPRRTLPDGSNFQFQHWSHTFEHAIAGGPGDWRAADAVRRGHDYNNPLLARALGAQSGELPPRASLLEVTPEQVVVSALKPAGNPMARMAAAAMDPAEGVTIRVYEASGRPADAVVRSHWPLDDGCITDVLEERRRPLEGDDGSLRFTVGGCQIISVGATPRLPRTQAARELDGLELGARIEPAQPVFSDYWLHNRGAAPIGYQPVTVQIRPGAVTVDGPFTIPVVVASERTDAPAAGTVTIAAPEGWGADPPSRLYRLEPGGHLTLDVEIAPPAGAAPGRYFVAARIDDELGQVHEDVVTVDLGVETRPPPAGAPWRGDAASRRPPTMEPIDADRRFGISPELAVSVPAEVTMARGERGQLAVAVTNEAASQIRGEMQLLSPYETWPAVTEWIRGFVVPARTSDIVTLRMDPPPGARPGVFWMLLKVMYFGRRLYSPPIPLVLTERISAGVAQRP